MKKEKTYTIVPAPSMQKLGQFLEDNHIEYSLLFGTDIPDDVPEMCIWHGHEMYRHLVCVVSEMDPAKLLWVDEELHRGKIPTL